MTNKDKDQDWLDALAGKPRADADPEVTQRATLMRQAIQRHDYALNVNEFDTEAGLQRLMYRMNKEGLIVAESKFNNIAKRWSAIIASLLSAFAFGIAITRFAMLPSMEGVKSNSDIVEIKNLNSFAQKVPVYVSDPSTTAQLVVSEAIRLKLNITVNAMPEGYNLLVEGLISNSAEQNKMKNELGINKSASGNLLFQIQVKMDDK